MKESELLTKIKLICARRGVMLVSVESVAFNVAVTFGLAHNTELLPAAANTFYFINRLELSLGNATGTPGLFYSTNSLQGTAGVLNFPVVNRGLMDWEVDSLSYNVSGHSAGTFYLFGCVFKITTA